MDEKKDALIGERETLGLLVEMQLRPEAVHFKEVARLRALYFRETLPWMDARYRLLPGRRVFLFLSWINSLRDEIERLDRELNVQTDQSKRVPVISFKLHAVPSLPSDENT